MSPAPAPAPAPRAREAAAPVNEKPAAAPPPKGNGALIGVGVGVVVLGALGFGAYKMMGSKPPAPATSAATTQAAAPAPTPAPPVVVAPAPVPATAAATPTPATPAHYDVSEEFARVVQGQASGFNVQLRTNRPSYRIGKDELRFSVLADRAGYLYTFVYGADKTLTQLYPNDSSGPLRVVPGQMLTLPRGTQEYWATTDPPGPEQVLVLISPQKRDLSALHPRKDGIVTVYPTGDEAAALAANGGAPSLAGKAICPATGACDDSYGAALAKVEIVK